MIRQMDPQLRSRLEFVPQAIIKRSPAFFAGRGLAFRAAMDDLNAYEVAELALDDIPFALLRHHGTPPDETELCLPDSILFARIRR